MLRTLYASGALGFLVIVATASAVFCLWTLIDSIKGLRRGNGTKKAWVAAIVLAGPLGAAAYLFFGRVPRPEDDLFGTSSILSLAILAATTVAAFIGYQSVHRAPEVYPFAVPFVVSGIVCSLAGVVPLFVDARAAKLVQNLLVAPAAVLFLLTVIHWSGGDDGGGMVMIGAGGPAMLAAAALALINTGFVLQDE